MLVLVFGFHALNQFLFHCIDGFDKFENLRLLVAK